MAKSINTPAVDLCKTRRLAFSWQGKPYQFDIDRHYNQKSVATEKMRVITRETNTARTIASPR